MAVRSTFRGTSLLSTMGWYPGNVSAIFILFAVCMCGGPLHLTAAPVHAALETFESSSEQSCDVTVWDSTMEDKSVKPISVQCSDGTVTWRSPYGGLQISVLPPSTRGRHFEACFFASASYAAVRLSIEHRDILRTIYVLKAQNGTVSGSGTDADDNDDRCFRFTRDRHPLTLYAEVDSAMTSLAVGRLTVEYSVRRIVESDDGTLDNMAECRPCSNDELLERVCSADFAVDGVMSDVTESSNHRWSLVQVDVVKIVHQSASFIDFLDHRRRPVPTSPTSSSLERQNVDAESSSIDGSVSQHSDVLPLPAPPFPSVRAPTTTTTAGRRIVVSIPSLCQVHSGYGRFLFVGDVHLKRSLRMACAPRSEHFWRMWNQAVTDGLDPCKLSSTRL